MGHLGKGHVPQLELGDVLRVLGGDQATAAPHPELPESSLKVLIFSS